MGLVVGIVAIKAVVTGTTGRLFGLSFDQNVLFTVVLSQIGESPSCFSPLSASFGCCPRRPSTS
jgi:hypothetical protein